MANGDLVRDRTLKVRHKFVGPCCRIGSYFDGTTEDTKSLDVNITTYVETVLDDDETNVPAMSGPFPPPIIIPDNGSCIIKAWSDGAGCPINCGGVISGHEFQWRILKYTQHNLGMNVSMESCLIVLHPIPGYHLGA